MTSSGLSKESMNIIDTIILDAASIATLHRSIHAHPELAFDEQRRSSIVQAATMLLI